MSSLRPLIFGALLGIAAATIVLGLAGLGLFDTFEGFTYDMRVRMMAPPVDVPVKIIVLDQGSLDAGDANGWTWPWSREVYPYLISFCRRTSVKALAFDVYFTEHHADVPGDSEFAAAVEGMPNYIGALIASAKIGDARKWPAGTAQAPLKLAGLDAWLERHPDAPMKMTAAVFPYPELAKATRTYGHVRSAPEGDSVVRRVFPVQEFDGRAVPRLAMAAWITGGFAAPPAMSIEGDTLRIGDRALQLDDQGTSLLHFYKPRDGSDYAFEVYALADVLQSEFAIAEGKEPKLSPEVFKDCYVLFGFSAPGLYDLKATPMHPAMPGVELQATTLANLLRGDTMSLPPGAAVAVMTLLWSALAAGAVALGGKWWRLTMIAAVALAVPVAIGVLMYRASYWWPIVSPLIAAATAVTAAIVFIYTTESKQRRFIRSAFSRYLSNDVIERLLKDPDQLKLGGEVRELTIFFSDVKGFSSISERLSPSSITALLNDLLSEIAQIIQSEAGTLDKYMGDGVVAFWNAPLEQPDHAVRAVRAAIRCQRRFAEREEHFRALAGGHPVEVRIGINTGKVLVGNLGSPERFDYSVMGDDANLAARLEGANKAFGTHILASLETWSRTNGQFKGRALGRVMVVGRETPVQIVEPLCFADEPLPASALKFIAAIAMVGEGRVEQAIAQLESLTDDPVSAAFVNYLRTLDPKQVVDGVWRLTSK